MATASFDTSSMQQIFMVYPYIDQRLDNSWRGADKLYIKLLTITGKKKVEKDFYFFIDSEHEINLSEKGLEVFHSRHFVEV